MKMKTEIVRTNTPSAGLVRVPAGTIERRIYLIRGQKVMLDSDLAKLYHVLTKAFNQAVMRNRDRFPKDFMFQLVAEEARALRSQSVTLEDTVGNGRGQHRKYAPFVFTEHGIAMLSSVLRSKRAVQMNIQIIRAFVRMREMLAEHKDLAARVDKLEAAQQRHVSVITLLANEIQEMKKAPATKRLFGFQVRRKN
jgi:phage regulator Rha-like protein